MKSTKVQVVFYGALVRVFAPPRGGNVEACIISNSQKGPCTPDSAILEQKRAGLNSESAPRLTVERYPLMKQDLVNRGGSGARTAGSAEND